MAQGQNLIWQAALCQERTFDKTITWVLLGMIKSHLQLE